MIAGARARSLPPPLSPPKNSPKEAVTSGSGIAIAFWPQSLLIISGGYAVKQGRAAARCGRPEEEDKQLGSASCPTSVEFVGGENSVSCQHSV